MNQNILKSIRSALVVLSAISFPAFGMRMPSHPSAARAGGDSLPPPVATSIVLLPHDLGNQAIAIVEFRPGRNEQCLIIVAEQRVNDRVLLRAQNVVFTYQLKHPEDIGHVKFTLFSDGRVEASSDKRGAEIGTHVPIAEKVTEHNELTSQLLQQASSIAATNVPGYGPARVVEFIRTSPKSPDR